MINVKRLVYEQGAKATVNIWSWFKPQSLHSSGNSYDGSDSLTYSRCIPNTNINIVTLNIVKNLILIILGIEHFLFSLYIIPRKAY